MEAHQAQAHRPLSGGRIDRRAHRGRGAGDEVLQHIVEEAHHVLDEAGIVAPFQELLGVDRRQAAHRGALLAQVVLAGVEHDLRAQVRLAHLHAQLALVLGHGAVHGVGEDQVGLAGLQADLDDLLPQGAGVDRLDHFLGLGRAQAERRAVAHGFHELIGQVDAVVQVQRLAVEVPGRLADLEELLDLRVVDVEVDRGRTAAQGPLRDGQGQAVHHADEGDDARGLALALDLLADGADAAPVGADAAAVGRQPHVLVPGPDDAVEAVADRVQETADRQAALGAAVRQHRGGRHEPELGDVVVDALGVLAVVGVGGRHPGEHVLIGLARQQVTVFEGGLAEVGQKIVARALDLDLGHQPKLRLVGRPNLRPILQRTDRFLSFAADHLNL